MEFIHTSPEESQRFGRAVGRATVPHDAPQSWIQRFIPELGRSAFDLVILRYPSSSVTAFECLSTCETFTPIFADTLLYFAWEDRGGDLVVGRPVIARDEIDELIVSSMISEIFAGYRNHYYANSRLDPALVAVGYAEWAQRVAGRPDNPLIGLLVDERPAALAVIDGSSGEWDVALAGVMPEQRGRGVYGDLILATMAAARAAGRDTVKISTQSHNVQVIRTWERLGWRMTSAFLTVHLERQR